MHHLRFRNVAAIALLTATILAPRSEAVDLTWGGGAGFWNNIEFNTPWVGPSPWIDGANAVFNTAGATITVNEFVNVGNIGFSGSSPYTIDIEAGLTVSNGITNSVAQNQAITMTGGFLELTGGTITNVAGGNTSISISGGIMGISGTGNAGSATISNSGGSVYISDTASGGTASLTNDATSTFDLVGLTSSGTTLGSLNNSGSVDVVNKTLTLSTGLTMNGGSNMNFSLGSPSGSPTFGRATSGNILLADGTSIAGTSTPNSNSILINISNAGGLAAGTYTLIDWSGAGITSGNVEVGDFFLGALPAGLSGATHLEINDNQLQLIAVPEPATLMMPLVAVLGLGWLRRRAARMAA